MVDLVPANLGTEQILDLVRLVDPHTYASNRLTTGRGPGQATLVHREVLRRAGLEAMADEPDPVTYLELTAQLKRFATKSIDLAVLDDLGAAPEDLRRRRGYLAALYSKAAPAVVAVPITHDLLLAAGLVLAPGWSLAAALAYCLQPYLALRGTAVRPDDLTPTYAATRPLQEMMRTVAHPHRRRAASRPARPRPNPTRPGSSSYDDLLADGIDRFFEPRRDRCPLCQGTALSVLVRSADLLQYKPGEFVLEECGECGHVFQNPRLSLEGLDFYYRDFYDGLGEEQLDFVFSSDDASYLGRVDLVATHAQPKRWLDVGAGHGHFCLIASDVLPDTRFDGLDLSDGIDEAERRQWVERGYRGLFTELADELRGRLRRGQHAPLPGAHPRPGRRAGRRRHRPRVRGAPADRGARSRVPVRPGARLDVGALVPAPAPALRVGGQPGRAAGRPGLHRGGPAAEIPAPARGPGLRPAAGHQPDGGAAAAAVARPALHRRPAAAQRCASPSWRRSWSWP